MQLRCGLGADLDVDKNDENGYDEDSRKRGAGYMRIGTIGTGEIVRHILDAVAETEGIACEAVYSRSYEKG